MIRSAFLFATLLLAACQPAAPALKVYVLDCGTLKSANPAPLQARGVTTTDMSVAAYLIVHPKGTLLWETGVIPDDLIEAGTTTVFRATSHKTLVGQLKEIGYTPADIKYLALSHYHYDHSANGNRFAQSTWLVQKAEREAMFAKPLGPSSANSPDPETVKARFANLESSKTELLDGDHDVFGDGTVVIVSTTGHTPGHQSLYVNLPKTGPILLSGDLYHYPAERELKDFTPFAALGDAAMEEAAKAKVDVFLREKQAKLWIQHDLIANATMKKAPAFYD